MSAAADPELSLTRARRVRQLFDAALGLEPSARAAFVSDACGTDRALRDELEGLLAALEVARTADLLPAMLARGEAATATDPDGPGRARPGVRVANYEIEAEIASGGMGRVFRARHLLLPRTAAIKVLHEHLSGDREMVQRFLNEARAVNAIRHPNIVEVLDAGILDGGPGTPYIVMEYLEGESLGARLRRAGPLPVAPAVAIALETASALAAAHDQRVVHRDLKPENVFLARAAGGAETVKVLDFGISKLRADLAGALVDTQAGALLGTPQYMAPEQWRGAAAADHRTDIYALGLILHEMLSGSPPFRGDSWVDLLRLHVSEPPPPLRAARADVPPALAAVVERALAKDPDQRPVSMRVLARELAAAVPEAPVPAGLLPSPTEAPARAPARRRRERWPARAAIAIAVLVTAALSLAALSSRGTRRPAAARVAAPPAAASRPTEPAAPPPPAAPALPAGDAPVARATAREPIVEQMAEPSSRRRARGARARAGAGKPGPRADSGAIPEFLRENPYK